MMSNGAKAVGLDIWRRVQPFVALFDARYLPLLFAVSPQSYAVYQWLWAGSDKSSEAGVFAILGALGYELIYVGAIAWTEHQTFNGWTRATAWTALFFSIAIAVYVYRDQGYAAALHAGFPIVAFAYTMAMHTHNTPQAVVQLSLWERVFGRKEVTQKMPAIEALPIQAFARSVQPPEPIEVREVVKREQPKKQAQPRKTQGESKKDVVWRMAGEGRSAAEIVAETGYTRSYVAPEVSRYNKSLA